MERTRDILNAWKKGKYKDQKVLAETCRRLFRIKRRKYAVLCVSTAKNNRSSISNRPCITTPQNLTINRSNLYLDWWKNTPPQRISLILLNGVKINFIGVKEEHLFEPLLISSLPLALPPVGAFLPPEIKPHHTWLSLVQVTQPQHLSPRQVGLPRAAPVSFPRNPSTSSAPPLCKALEESFFLWNVGPDNCKWKTNSPDKWAGYYFIVI